MSVKNPLHTTAWLLVTVLTLVLLYQVLWLYYLSPRQQIRRIELDSDFVISDEQLMKMLQINNLSWAHSDEQELSRHLESYPVIRSARVLKVFPDTLRIYIFRRQPLIVNLDNSTGKISSTVFDEEGYVVQVDDLAESENLPILSGLQLDNPVLGARMPESIQSILKGLYLVRKEDSHLFNQLSEINIISRKESGYTIKLYWNHLAIPVLIDPSLRIDDLRRSLIALEILSATTSGNIAEVDIRGGSFVYYESEES